jgi:cytochrome c peroxidase
MRILARVVSARPWRLLALATVLLALSSVAGAAAGKTGDREPGYAWQLPDGFPRPNVPADNPMSEAKVQLGRRPFYDRRLSGNGKQSCSSCHL